MLTGSSSTAEDVAAQGPSSPPRTIAIAGERASDDLADAKLAAPRTASVSPDHAVRASDEPVRETSEGTRTASEAVQIRAGHGLPPLAHMSPAAGDADGKPPADADTDTPLASVPTAVAAPMSPTTGSRMRLDGLIHPTTDTGTVSATADRRSRSLSDDRLATEPALGENQSGDGTLPRPASPPTSPDSRSADRASSRVRQRYSPYVQRPSSATPSSSQPARTQSRRHSNSDTDDGGPPVSPTTSPLETISESRPSTSPDRGHGRGSLAYWTHATPALPPPAEESGYRWAAPVLLDGSGPPSGDGRRRRYGRRRHTQSHPAERPLEVYDSATGEVSLEPESGPSRPRAGRPRAATFVSESAAVKAVHGIMSTSTSDEHSKSRSAVRKGKGPKDAGLPESDEQDGGLSGRFACPHLGCGKVFTRENDLKRHGTIHRGERSHACPKCKKPFNRKDAMERHRRSCRDAEMAWAKIRCTNCGTHFEKRLHLEQHAEFCRWSTLAIANAGAAGPSSTEPASIPPPLSARSMATATSSTVASVAASHPFLIINAGPSVARVDAAGTPVGARTPVGESVAHPAGGSSEIDELESDGHATPAPAEMKEKVGTIVGKSDVE